MRKATLYTGVIALVLIFGVLTTTGFAQGFGKGRLTGKVLDENGKPVKGVTVTMKYAGSFNAQTGKFKKAQTDTATISTTKTNGKGGFTFMNLGTGAYDVTVEVKGYRPINRRVSVYQGARNPPLNMKLGKATATVVKEKLTADASLVEQGNALYAEGKYEEALEAFKGFHTKTPEFFEIYINFGNCLLKMDKLDEAIAEYNTFLEKAGADNVELKAKAFASIGEVYIKKNDMEKAQGYFKQSVDMNPKDEILAFNVATIFFGNNKNEDAVKYFKIAAEIKPTWGDPHLKMGYVYLNLGDMKAAAASFEKFVELSPDHPEAATVKDLAKSLKEM